MHMAYKLIAVVIAVAIVFAAYGWLQHWRLKLALKRFKEDKTGTAIRTGLIHLEDVSTAAQELRLAIDEASYAFAQLHDKRDEPAAGYARKAYAISAGRKPFMSVKLVASRNQRYRPIELMRNGRHFLRVLEEAQELTELMLAQDERGSSTDIEVEVTAQAES